MKLETQTEFAKRFWSKVEQPHECWEWQGTKGEGGYGQIMYNYQNKRAHRVAYELIFGPIPAGLILMHTCDNPRCVNPFHLKASTPGDNVRDCVCKGRHRTNPRRGGASPMSRMGDAGFERVLSLYSTGLFNFKDLAPVLNVSRPSIESCLKGKTWSHRMKEAAAAVKQARGMKGPVNAIRTQTMLAGAKADSMQQGGGDRE
jgi:hypothetical protein